MPLKVETFFDPVLGLIEFPTAAALAAWLDAEVDPSTEMSEFDGIFYDLFQYGPVAVRQVLDDVAARGMNVELEERRVLLFGCPGEGLVGADDVALVAACLGAGPRRGDGVVLFTGTAGSEDADFALVLGGGGHEVRWFEGSAAPPRLPISPARLARALGDAFDAHDDVESALMMAEYELPASTDG